MQDITDEIRFHDFVVVNRRTGFTMRMTQIGATREDAERTIRNFNLATLDFENDYELRPIVDFDTAVKIMREGERSVCKTDIS